MTQTFKIDDRVKKVRGVFAPYEMLVTHIRNEPDGQHLRGIIVSGGKSAQHGTGEDRADCFELVQSVMQPTDAELAATYRAGREALFELQARGYLFEIGGHQLGRQSEAHRSVRITLPEVREVVIKTPRTEI